jgi:hypothetical protein
VTKYRLAVGQVRLPERGPRPSLGLLPRRCLPARQAGRGRVRRAQIGSEPRIPLCDPHEPEPPCRQPPQSSRRSLRWFRDACRETDRRARSGPCGKPGRPLRLGRAQSPGRRRGSRPRQPLPRPPGDVSFSFGIEQASKESKLRFPTPDVMFARKFHDSGATAFGGSPSCGWRDSGASRTAATGCLTA